MIRRPTVVYIVLFLALAGTYYYLNHRSKPADIAVTAEPSSEVLYLFTPQDGTPSSIQIESKAGQAVEIARGADQAWTVTKPTEAKAEQAAAEAAASQITTISVLDTVPNVDPKIVGLETPEYILTVKFTNGVERTVDIGVVTPTESGYYVRNAEGKVIIASKSAIDAMLELLNNPPYLETLTPNPPTETSMPLPASQTPEASATSNEKVTPTP